MLSFNLSSNDYTHIKATEDLSVIDLSDLELCPTSDDEGLTGDIYMSECAMESLQSANAILLNLKKESVTSAESSILGKAANALKIQIGQALKRIMLWAKSWLEYLVNRIKGKFVEGYVNSVLKSMSADQLKKAYEKYAKTAKIETYDIPKALLAKNIKKADTNLIQRAYDISIASLEGISTAVRSFGKTSNSYGGTIKEDADYIEEAVKSFSTRVCDLLRSIGVTVEEFESDDGHKLDGKNVAYSIICGQNIKNIEVQDTLVVSDAYSIEELLSYFTSKAEIKRMYIESAKSVRSTQLIMHDCETFEKLLDNALDVPVECTNVGVEFINMLSGFTYTLFNYRMHNIKSAMACVKSLYAASKDDTEVQAIGGTNQSEVQTSSSSTTLGALKESINFKNTSEVIAFCKDVCKRQLTKLQQPNTNVDVVLGGPHETALASCKVDTVKLADGSMIAFKYLTDDNAKGATVFKQVISVHTDGLDQLPKYAKKYLVTPEQWLAALIVHETTHATQPARFDGNSAYKWLSHLRSYSTNTVASYNSFAVENDAFKEQLKFLLSCAKSPIDKKLIKERFLRGFSGGMRRTAIDV